MLHATVASNVVKAIRDDTADAGRNSAFMATRTVIDTYNLDNNPFFGTSAPTDSRSFIENHTLELLNQNVTNTCRAIEQQTGRTIIINGLYNRSIRNRSIAIFSTSDMAYYPKRSIWI